MRSGNFWVGVIVGALLYWAWLRYQTRKSTK